MTPTRTPIKHPTSAEWVEDLDLSWTEKYIFFFLERQDWLTEGNLGSSHAVWTAVGKRQS